jgi:hypothetical protein
VWPGVWHLVAAQLVGDYPLQPGWLLRWKMRSPWGVVAHSAILASCAAIALAPDLGRGWWFVVLLFGALHYVLDWGKLAFAPRYPAPRIVLYLQDQMQDFGGIVALIGIGRLAGLPGPKGILHNHMWSLYWLIGYLLATFFASILIFEFRRSVGRQSKPILTYAERVPGFVERGTALAVVMAGAGAFAPLVFAPRAIMSITKRAHRDELVLGGVVVALCAGGLHTLTL